VDDQAACVSVMWVNNETGVMQDIPSLVPIATARGALFHTDAVQAFGKVAIDLKVLAVDYLTISGHKIGAPKGIGAMFIRRGTPLEPMMHGGSQDRGAAPEPGKCCPGLAIAAELVVAEHGRMATRRASRCARAGSA
jgi:cysteine desulfurase